MNTWWGDNSRRSKTLQIADAIYAAGSGDPKAAPAIARLAVDPEAPPFPRASAAGFLGRLSVPSQTPNAGAQSLNAAAGAAGALDALIKAAGDPEATVRIAAVRSLGASDHEHAWRMLADRLSDPSRVVRISAAEGLLLSGVTTLDGAAGEALMAAQIEYADSLRTFGDAAYQHTTLGWLRASQGRTDEARQELALALSIDPDDVRPRLYLGILAARAGRYDEAIAQWKTMRERHPDYPGIDRFLEEAAARRRRGASKRP
jgi:tetratricopeptide (TPR) repeat protein